MKKMKKFLLLMTCTFVLLGTAACSSKDNVDNGADQSTTGNQTSDDNGNRTDDRTDNTDTDDRNMNDATGGNGVLDDAVDDVTDGVDRVTDDVTDGVDRAADDLTEDNGVTRDTQDNNR